MSPPRSAIALTLGALGCGASTETVRLGELREDAGHARAEDAAASCVAPVGWVRLEDGHSCLAVRVGPSRAVALASCLRDPSGSAYVPARTMIFRQEVMRRDEGVIRVVHLRDADDERPEADLAVITLARGEETAPVAGLRDGTVLPARLVMARGTRGAVALTPPCQVTQSLGSTLSHDCVRAPVGDVGALLECAAGVPTLYGLDPGGVGPTTATSGLREIPLRPRSVAVGASSGSTLFFAYDEDSRRVHVRQRAGAGWAPWRALTDDRWPQGERAGSLTAFSVFGGYPHLAFHEAAAVVQYRWDSVSEASGFGPWFPYRPASNVDAFVDLASSGGPADRAHVYALTRTGEALTQYKQNLTPSADWSPWCSLGEVPGATHIAATRFSNGAPTYQVFAATGSAVVTRWASGPRSECGTWSPSGDAWAPLRADAPAGVSSLAAGARQDGRAYVALVDRHGVVHTSTRAADGSRWDPWTPLPDLGELRAVAAGTLSGDGATPREVLFAITREDLRRATSEGELVVVTTASGGSMTDARPRRFYR